MPHRYGKRADRLTGRPSCAAKLGLGASQVALHGRLAREVDPALAVDLDHHNHDLVADRDNVLDGRDVVVGQLADPDQTFLAGKDLDEAAEAHDPGYFAQVEPADLDLASQRLDPLDRLARVLTRHCCDLDRAVVLDVDLGAGFLLDLADHGATLADDVADLLGVDLDGDDARRVVAHLRAAGRDDRVHLVEDCHPRGVGLLQTLANDRFADALDLDVHLECRYALAGAGHLEVHVAEGILFAENVGQDNEATVRLTDETHRRATNGGFDRHARIHEGEAGTAGRRHRGGAIRRHALADEADDVRELILGRQDRQQRPLSKMAVADLTPTGAAHRLVLAGAIGRHVVVVEEPLLGLRADRVDPLHVRGRAKGGDRQCLSLAAGEKPGTMSPRQDANLNRNRPNLVDAAAVHSDALGDDHVAGGLLVHEVEQALAYASLATSRLEQAGRVLAFLAVGADRDRDAVLQVGDAVGGVGGELRHDCGRRLCIGEAAMGSLNGDAEEAGDVAELVRLEVRIGLASDHEGVEVATLDELAALTESLVEEGDVEADVVANDGCAGNEGQQLLRGFASHGSARNVGVSDAVHLGAEDLAARVHEGREAVDDLAVTNANCADLDQVGNLGIAAGRLGIENDDLVTGLADLLDELQNGAGAGLEIHGALGLANGGAQLFLDVDERLEGAVAEEDGIGHDVFGNDLGAGLDHHDRVAGAGDDEVYI